MLLHRKADENALTTKAWLVYSRTSMAGEAFRIGGFVLTQEEVEKRKTYFAFQAEDELLLREAHPAVAPHQEEIVERFYDFLLSHDHTRKILDAPGLVPRLKKIQTQYFLELTRGPYDLDYFENRLRVGLAHERIGLSPEWYLGAYNKYLQIVTDVLGRAFGADPERFSRTSVALGKVIALDVSLAIDAYVHSGQARLAEKASALEHANQELLRLGAEKRRLTDMIVHDLQNPLAGIVAFLQILRDRSPGLDADEARSLEEALARCNDLAQLILNVLQLSRAEEGKLDLYFENVDVSEVARSTVDAFLPVATHGGRDISFVGPEVAAVCRTDRSLLRRVLFNLVRNALRHTPPGTRVEVTAREGPPVVVSVRDTGPGIPEGVQARIFEPGALREAGLPMDSGLGLVFCKMASEAMGMRLVLRSTPGEGTTFELVGSENESARKGGPGRG